MKNGKLNETIEVSALCNLHTDGRRYGKPTHSPCEWNGSVARRLCLEIVRCGLSVGFPWSAATSSFMTTSSRKR